MEQFVLVPASVYNKNWNTQLLKKRELPNYQPLKDCKYQSDLLKKEINKKLFAKADCLVDKIWSCPHIKLSNSYTSVFDGVRNGNSLSDFDQQLRRKNADFPNKYLTLPDAGGISPALILNENVAAKKRGV